MSIKKTRIEACTMLKDKMYFGIKRMAHQYGIDFDSLSEYSKYGVEKAAKDAVMNVVSQHIKTEDDCESFKENKNEFTDNIGNDVSRVVMNNVAPVLLDISVKKQTSVQ